uniref:Uncharacterized protein n=1 Tax=Escherichia coli TaxID=562 RepID=A0A7G8AHV7_ECOLX|nr:hypothetical protein [Escherichia coli]
MAPLLPGIFFRPFYPRNAPGRRELAGARANCGILRRKSA